MIKRRGQHMLALVDDLLDSAQAEAGRLSLELGPARLDRVVEEAVAPFQPQASRSGVELRMADARRLAQIVTNLVGNALKFTERGAVVVRLRRLSDEPGVRVRLEVVDTGIGIPEAGRARLFQQFGQLDSSAARRHTGTGLGLVISAQLVRLMGGQIGYSSQEGIGSTFWVELPFR